jgi:ribonuclease Y
MIESLILSINTLALEADAAKKNFQDKTVELQKELEKVAGLTSEEAKQRLITSVEGEARHEAAKLMKQIEENAKEEAERKANWIIGTSLQRLANHHVQEKTVSVVPIPSDELKGRIIGREGRNIRTLEQLTGIDLIVDDTPEAVVISGFNPLRREVARLTLEELIRDGRIHPARIEEVVHKVEKDLDKHIKELGQQAAFDLGIQNMHPELLKMVGKLNYRTSYGQNQYKHAIEASFIAGMLASEMGEDVKLAKRGGLLHDIGKVIDHEVEGSHAVIGAEFARKYGEDKRVWHAVGAHHEDYPIETVMDIIVQAADAISGARPGARREALETYSKRLEDLERISTDFKGVEKAFAIQAGREIRVIVTNQTLSDEETVFLSRDIAKKIESEMTYPGQIKVTVIRETRAVEYAR